MDKKTPYRIVASGKKAERRDYSKVSGNLELPNLVEIQTDSFEWFKNDGIAEVFNEIYPIQNYGGNIRLKFLGYAVLAVVASDFLYRKYPTYPEGQLTKLRASMVCEQTLALCARELGLGQFLLLGKGEESTGGRMRPSMTSDAMEALIGAIFLDGGFSQAKEAVHRLI